MEKAEFKSLSPFKDDKGIIRVGGRVDKAIVSYEQKHPALLPSEPDNKAHAPPGAHWGSHHCRKNKKEVLETERKQAQQVCQVQVLVL